MSEIRCTSFKEVDKGVMKGFATIFVPKWGVEIYNVQMCRKDNSKWINFPSRQIEKDGEKKFLPYIRFEKKEHMDAFSSKVWAAVDKWIQENSPSVFNDNGSAF